MRPAASMSMFVGLFSCGERAHTVTSKPSGTWNRSEGTSAGAGLASDVPVASADWAKADGLSANRDVSPASKAGRRRQGVSGNMRRDEDVKTLAVQSALSRRREAIVSLRPLYRA